MYFKYLKVGAMKILYAQSRVSFIESQHNIIILMWNLISILAAGIQYACRIIKTFNIPLT